MLNRKNIWKVVTVVTVILLISSSSMAQCAMCRATVGSNLSEGRGVIGTGINFGILYLLFTPYLLVGVLAFVWFRVSKKELTNKLSLSERVKNIYKN
jgi:heme/copper-type cytochrome/quinol oxidase subunit 3